MGITGTKIWNSTAGQNCNPAIFAQLFTNNKHIPLNRSWNRGEHHKGLYIYYVILNVILNLGFLEGPPPTCCHQLLYFPTSPPSLLKPSYCHKLMTPPPPAKLDQIILSIEFPRMLPSSSKKVCKSHCYINRSNGSQVLEWSNYPSLQSYCHIFGEGPP